jgi:hypothetical protein
MYSARKLEKGKTLLAIVLAAGLIVFASSCGKPKKPPGILGERELSDLIVEMYVAEARLSIMAKPADTSAAYFQPFEEAFLKRKKLSRKVLKETYRYYLDHPSEFEKIYDTVIDTLSLRERRVQKQGVRKQVK